MGKLETGENMQRSMFPKICEECGKEKKNLIAYRGKKICYTCWFEGKSPNQPCMFCGDPECKDAECENDY